MKKILPAYIEECRSRGILELRIVHGKGTGTMRKIVHSILDRLTEEVAAYEAGGMGGGGWGATLVTLNPLPE